MKLGLFSWFFGLQRIPHIPEYGSNNHNNTCGQKDIVEGTIHNHSGSVQRRLDKFLVLHIGVCRSTGMRIIRCWILSAWVGVLFSTALNGLLHHRIAFHENLISLINSDEVRSSFSGTTHIGMVLLGQASIRRFYFGIGSSDRQLENTVVFIKKTHCAKVKKTIE